jgi:sarcosine/dimethylglycine N-methyltransferase
MPGTRTFNQEEATSQSYYDSEDAFNFYKHVWGGHHIHIGIYDGVAGSGIERIVKASDQSLDRVFSKMEQNASSPWNSETQVMDMGSAYGGSARVCAKKYGCPVTCIDISAKENARNREMTKEQGLEHLVQCPGDLSYCDTGVDAESCDFVYSMDSFLHAGSMREKAVEEAARVLKPGAIFAFTDIMQTGTGTKEQLQPVYDRLHLVDMGSPQKYREWCATYNLEFVEFDDQSHQLKEHYGEVCNTLAGKREELHGKISDEFMKTMIHGLEEWVKTTTVSSDLMAWGVMTFRKKAE